MVFQSLIQHFYLAFLFIQNFVQAVAILLQLPMRHIQIKVLFLLLLKFYDKIFDFFVEP